ncbi:FKBP-type peptidyl-prolyl cis-trans isomerase [Novosphingobium tardum]|uniref:Peptidyl-prolyl cis-trans isomerase n=1 Tax=Novosphingobium tardum TaxID=1538021 RepID=A0ABV8RRS3_9SPHN
MSTIHIAQRALLAGLALALAIPATAAAPAKPVKPAATIIPLPLKQIIPAGQRLCTGKTASGLGTMALRPGAAGHPGADDAVQVNYIGYLAATGEVFDQGAAAAFPVGGVIPGFGEGLQTMGKGGVTRLCIPAALAYGAKQTGPIPANSDLVFQVELLDYVADEEAAAPAPAPAPATGG